MVLGVNLAQAFAAAGAMAQYPNKPIRFILPFPGGATDFLGRVVGQRLAEALGQPVVIDIRPGAGGNLGIELDSLFIGIPAPAPHIKAGRLRGLAVLASQRSPVLPEVPTATEAGLPGFEVTTWYGVLAPAGTPKDIVARLNREIVKIMNTPDTKERLAVVAADPMTSSPEQFAAYIKQEIARWSKVVRTAGLRAD